MCLVVSGYHVSLLFKVFLIFMQEISDRNLKRIIAEPQSVRTQIRLRQWFWNCAYRTL